MLGTNENHCRKINCRCTHTEGCERGYIFVRYSDTKIVIRKGMETKIVTWYDGVQFCSVCDPERAHIQQTSASTEEMQQRLRERSSYKNIENYEKQEANKTRTL